MEIIIDNLAFPYDIGCRLIKTKYAECPFDELLDVWDDIAPITFKEIAEHLKNIEQRRVAINCLGIARLVKEVKPKLINKQTINKTTAWVNDDGTLETRKFNDTYELYQVSAKSLGIENNNTWSVARNYFHYIRCKDTSTYREYLLWVDASSVYRVNSDERWFTSGENYGSKINAIQAIAWTIQTDIEEGGIEEIVRQGDCILIKEKKDAKRGVERHLTEKEYRKLLVAES
jgi:hypothetical protein